MLTRSRSERIPNVSGWDGPRIRRFSGNTSHKIAPASRSSSRDAACRRRRRQGDRRRRDRGRAAAAAANPLPGRVGASRVAHVLILEVCIYIYGFLVCRYARSLGLAARQNTPAIDGAFYRPNGTSYQLQPSFHTQSTEPEPTARARRAGKEFY